jgi:hypothetical protein
MILVSNACAGSGIGSASQTEAAPTADVTSTAVAATLSAEPTATPTPYIDHWTVTSFPVFEVVLERPADWEAVEGPRDGGTRGTRLAGLNGFVQVGAIRGMNINDVARAEADDRLQPYGSKPIIEELDVQGQPARLIAPDGQADDLARQAALVVAYSQPLNIGGHRYDFLILWADRQHIRPLVQTLRFTADVSSGTTPTPRGTPAWDHLPPGLTYSTFDGLWQVGKDEKPVQIHADAQAIISPDGRWLLSYDAIERDAWLIDRIAGTVRNLTHTADELECCFHWWPARPDLIVFGSTRPEGGTEGRHPLGVRYYPAAAGLDGQDYRILDTEHQMNTSGDQGSLALAPDGGTIVYGMGRHGWLYRLESGGAETFDPLTYGLDLDAPFQIAQPAWSPGGRHLAWILKGDVLKDGSSAWTGVVVFDLEARTGQILYRYASQGTGWPPTPVWSPDGDWLAFVDSSTPEQAGLWVAKMRQGSRMHHLGPGGNPVWSPDARWLAFQSVGAEGPPRFALAEAGVWQVRALDIPGGRYGQLVAWTAPVADVASGMSITGTVKDAFLSARVILLQEPVAGFDSIALTEETELVSADGSVMRLRDTRPGMTIEAFGRPGLSNALIATRVLLLARTPTPSAEN